MSNDDQTQTTDDEPTETQARISGFRGDSLTLRVPEDVVEDTDHSFKTVARGTTIPDGEVTVKLEAGFTRLRWKPYAKAGADVVFDGVAYRLTDYDGKFRPPERADVNFTPADGSDYWPDEISDTHPVRYGTVADLLDALRNGKATPLPKSDDRH
jgi:hypothetical protein